MLNKIDFMPHIMVYVFKYKINDRNGPRYFLKFGAVGIVKLASDMYTISNDRHHGLCFPDHVFTETSSHLSSIKTAFIFISLASVIFCRS